MTINLPYQSKFNKVSVTKRKGISKIRLRLNKEIRPYLTLGTRGRGGRGLGKFHEIQELYLDNQNRLLAGFDLKQEGGLMRTYAELAELIFLPEEDV
jgi:hypothetical protein